MGISDSVVTFERPYYNPIFRSLPLLSLFDFFFVPLLILNRR